MGVAELEAHFNQYDALEDRIRTKVSRREFYPVFALCLESFEHILPTLKYRKQKRLVPEIPSLLPFTVIWKYAPPLFEHAALRSLRDFVSATKSLARSDKGYLETTDDALEREEIARTIWHHLEENPGVLQQDLFSDLAVSQKVAAEILATWAELGIVLRRPANGDQQLHFRLKLDAAVDGVCHTCGARASGPKETFLRPLTCKTCGAQAYYHIQDAHPY